MVMNKEQGKKHTSQANEQQGGEHKNLDDLFKGDSKGAENETPEEEAAAEQQRKEALTERD
jgi:hypothetical protein